MEAVVVAVVGTAVLGGLWAAATRRHRRRRELRDADWRGTEARSDVWTSQARCPSCEATGGLITREGEELWLECLSCGGRHRRQERG